MPGWVRGENESDAIPVTDNIKKYQDEIDGMGIDKTHGSENKYEFHMRVAKYPLSSKLSRLIYLGSIVFFKINGTLT